jgi:hypothetical protein
MREEGRLWCVLEIPWPRTIIGKPIWKWFDVVMNQDKIIAIAFEWGGGAGDQLKSSLQMETIGGHRSMTDCKASKCLCWLWPSLFRCVACWWYRHHCWQWATRNISTRYCIIQIIQSRTVESETMSLGATGFPLINFFWKGHLLARIITVLFSLARSLGQRVRMRVDSSSAQVWSFQDDIFMFFCAHQHWGVSCSWYLCMETWFVLACAPMDLQAGVDIIIAQFWDLLFTGSTD